MMIISVKEFEQIENIRILGNKDATFEGLTYDSRKIKKGNLFVALKGKNFDGSDFVLSAFENGANVALSTKEIKVPEDKALIVADDCEAVIKKFAKMLREKFEGKIIGVVGSVGKTTTKDFLHKAFSLFDRTYSNYGNKNNLLGVPETIVNADFEAKWWILEMGISQINEMDELADIVNPNIVVFTSIKPVHIEFLGSLDGVFKEKIKVLNYLKEPKLYVYNNDDEYLKKIKEQFKYENYSYGFSKDSDLKIEILKEEDFSFLVNVNYRNDSVRLSLPFLNKANIYNFASAVLTSIIFYNDLKISNRIKEDLTFGEHRGQLYRLNDGQILYDDSYNSNPEAMKILMESLKNKNKKVGGIIGEMKELGKDSKFYHQEVGKMAAQVFDFLIVVGSYDSLPLYDEFSKSGKKAIFVNNWKDSLKHIEEVLKNELIVIKGSRSIGLDNVVKEILEKYGEIS